MPFLVYSVVALSVFKILVDAIGGNLLAPYSIFLETLLLGFLLAIVIRASLKQREGRRESVQEDLKEIKQRICEE